MNRHSILSISAMTVLGLSCYPAAPSANKGHPRSSSSEAGRLSQLSIPGADGTKVDTFGPNPGGLWMFDGNGRYASVVVRPGLPKFASNNRDAGTAEENKAAMQGSIAHVGRYTVNEADRSVTLHIEYSSSPNWNGTDQRRPITIAGDEMKYIVPTPSSGTGTSEVTFRRAGPATVGAGQGR